MFTSWIVGELSERHLRQPAVSLFQWLYFRLIDWLGLVFMSWHHYLTIRLIFRHIVCSVNRFDGCFIVNHKRVELWIQTETNPSNVDCVNISRSFHLIIFKGLCFFVKLVEYLFNLCFTVVFIHKNILRLKLKYIMEESKCSISSSFCVDVFKWRKIVFLKFWLYKYVCLWIHRLITSHTEPDRLQHRRLHNLNLWVTSLKVLQDSWEFDDQSFLIVLLYECTHRVFDNFCIFINTSTWLRTNDQHKVLHFNLIN